ncbi:MAG: hypothetical protein ACTHO8_06495 [Solirubrobacterales bacterium]
MILGRFDPTGLHLSLHWEDSEDQPYENRIAAMGALLHERTHWLQFVGTAAGRFSVWLSTLQSGLLLYDVKDGPPLSAEDLPLLSNPKVTETRRELWYSCEQVYASIFGAPQAYFDQLEANSKGLGIPELGHQLQDLGSQLLEGDDGYASYQGSVSSAQRQGTKTALLRWEDGAFGAAHLMECGARLNELFRLSEGIEAKGDGYEIDANAYLFPPYSTARDLYFEITGRTRQVEDEMAICVLVDWALNCPLPPVLPLGAVLGENPTLLPGPFFVWLAKNLDLDAITLPDSEATRVDWADEFAVAIYDQIASKTEVLTPLQMGELTLKLFAGLDSMAIPESIYEILDQERGWRPIDSLSRLRYLSILTQRAMRLRVEHPGFFPLPVSYYTASRELFHEYWDPIQPPIISIGSKRWVPTFEDPAWFSFFYISAIQHELAMSAADCDCVGLGRRLAHFTNPHLGSEAHRLLADAVTDVLGDGSATQAVVAAAMSYASAR